MKPFDKKALLEKCLRSLEYVPDLMRAVRELDLGCAECNYKLTSVKISAQRFSSVCLYLGPATWGRTKDECKDLYFTGVRGPVKVISGPFMTEDYRYLSFEAEPL